MYMKNNPGRTILERLYYHFADIFEKKEKVSKSYSSVEDMFKEEKEWRANHPIAYIIREWYYEIVYRFPKKVSRIPKEIKWFWQRGKRGWADCDVWGFFDYHSRVCKEALLHLKKYKMGYPVIFEESGRDGQKEWNEVLEKMICAFEQAQDIGCMDLYMYHNDIKDMTEFCKKYNVKLQTKEEYDAMIEGFRLFFEHYWNLWD